MLGPLVVSLGATYALAGVVHARGPHEWTTPEAIFWAPPDRICLTFDDGPDEDGTPAVLDALAMANARGTFFVVGRAVRRWPALVRRIVDEGHAVGNHTASHRSLLFAPSSVIAREIDDAQRAIEDAIGARTNLVRPPHGHRDFRFHRVARERGLVPVFWTLNVRDYARNEAAPITRALARARASDIVLLHDAGEASRLTARAIRDAFATPRAAHSPALLPITEAT